MILLSSVDKMQGGSWLRWFDDGTEDSWIYQSNRVHFEAFARKM